MTTPIRFLILLAALALPASASAVKVPKAPKTKIIKVQVNVSGYVETKVLHNTASDCFPGEYWIQHNRYAFGTGRFTNLSVKRVTGEGFAPIVTSPFTPALGTASVTDKILDYRTTNYCDTAPAPVQPQPACASTSGKTRVSIQEIPLDAVGDDDLAPLTHIRLAIVVMRAGGARDLGTCFGRAADQLTGTDTKTSLVTTSYAPNVPALTLPAGLSLPTLMNIRPGQTLKRTSTVSGTCTNAHVTNVAGSGSSPSAAQPQADGDCTIAGKLSYTIKPRSRY